MYVYISVSVYLKAFQKAWFCQKSCLLDLNLETHLHRESNLCTNHSNTDGSRQNALHDSYYIAHFQSRFKYLCTKLPQVVYDIQSV